MSKNKHIMSSRNSQCVSPHVAAVDSSERGLFWTTSVVAEGFLYSSGPAYRSSNGSTGSNKGSRASNKSHKTANNKILQPYEYHAPVPVKLWSFLIHPEKPHKYYSARVPIKVEKSELEESHNPEVDMKNMTIVQKHRYKILKQVKNQVENLTTNRNTKITVVLNFEFERNKMRDIKITVKDETYGAFMRFRRQDMTLQHVVGGSVPLNWIATVPLDFEAYPVVVLEINGQKKKFMTAQEVYVFSPQRSTIKVCVIFKNIPRSVYDYWLMPAAIPKQLYKCQKDEFKLLNEYFNSFSSSQFSNSFSSSQFSHSKNSTSPYCDFAVFLKFISELDSLLVQYEISNAKTQKSICLNSKSRFIEDMAFKAKNSDVSQSVHKIRDTRAASSARSILIVGPVWVARRAHQHSLLFVVAKINR